MQKFIIIQTFRLNRIQFNIFKRREMGIKLTLLDKYNKIRIYIEKEKR